MTVREERLRAAAVQLNSTDDKARNLAAAERLVRAAAADGAELVALPEKWNLLAGGEELLAGAEPLDGPSLSAARGWAGELGIHLLAGSVSEQGPEGKAFNTSVLIGPDGEDLAVYRKIHMFDVDVGGVAYRESEHEEPGEEIVTAPLGRAPPSASASVTTCASPSSSGSSPCAAPASSPSPRPSPRPPGATTGRCSCGRGRSRTRPSSSPPTRSARRRRTSAPTGTRRSSTPGGWCSAALPDEECFVAADLDFAAQERVRESLPSLANRRPRAYAWPQLLEAHA